MKNIKYGLIILLTTLVCSMIFYTYGAKSENVYENTRIEKTLRLDYNPPFFSKNCDYPNFAQLELDNYYSSEMDLKLLAHLDGKLIWDKTLTQNDFIIFQSMNSKLYGGKSNLSVPIPSYQTVRKDTSELTIQLIDSGKLIEEIETKVLYLEQDETIEVAYRPDCFLYQCGKKIPFTDKLLVNIDEGKSYYHSITQVREVVRKEDHFEYTLSFEPGSLFEKVSKKEHTIIPNIEPITTSIPLSFELVEGTRKRSGSGYYSFEYADASPITLGHAISEYGLGMQLKVKYEDCEMKIIEKTKIYVPEEMNLVAI